MHTHCWHNAILGIENIHMPVSAWSETLSMTKAVILQYSKTLRCMASLGDKGYRRANYFRG